MLQPVTTQESESEQKYYVTKISSDTSGIEPATFRFVAQHFNHCPTAVHNHIRYGH